MRAVILIIKKREKIQLHSVRKCRRASPKEKRSFTEEAYFAASVLEVIADHAGNQKEKKIAAQNMRS